MLWKLEAEEPSCGSGVSINFLLSLKKKNLHTGTFTCSTGLNACHYKTLQRHKRYKRSIATAYHTSCCAAVTFHRKRHGPAKPQNKNTTHFIPSLVPFAIRRCTPYALRALKASASVAYGQSQRNGHFGWRKQQALGVFLYISIRIGCTVISKCS
ncbi:hypothetical protein NPIL_672561 [Nephila pilipes]|uniref:Uncharacterized protein n=1 Tax=Nephila pilipes TaxID=299642 RepID=A0A8X6PFN6_NEPPI|nr:hypothetical protein NPIL_672561 [Nephila pilipes]